MTTIRRRRPRFEFVQILNAVARDYRVSWRARGLLVELLSYPADYETSVDDLVKRAKRQGGHVEGRDAMRAAARELKDVGYIVATRRQDARGRWVTDLEVTDEPMYDLLTEGSADPSEKPQVRDISAGRTDDGFSGVGEPGVGEPGVKKKTEKKTEKNSSPPLPSSAAASAAEHTLMAGREDEAAPGDGPPPEVVEPPSLPDSPAVNGEVLRRAESVVDAAIRRWPSTHRAPGPRDRQRLAERVARELVTGGDEATILDELTRDLADAGSAVRVILGARTCIPGWGRPADPRPDPTRYTVKGPKPAWCGRCDERTRLLVAIRNDGSEAMRRCPHCHPAAADPLMAF